MDDFTSFLADAQIQQRSIPFEMSKTAQTKHPVAKSFTQRFLEKAAKPWELTEDLLSICRAGYQFGPQPFLGRVRLRQKIRFINQGSFHLGDKTVFHPGPRGSEILVFSGAHCWIGADCRINYGLQLICSQHITIGDRVRMGIDVIILDNHLHHQHPKLRGKRPEPQPICIEQDVWIASRSIILPGVTIGAGSIVAAGSIVTRSVPPMTLVAGVPAQPIRQICDEDASLFADDQIF